MGFPPRSGSAREEWLDAVGSEPGPVICFEAPTRIEHTLRDLAATVGKRPILVCRELSKIHEKLVEYSIDASIPARGEFTIVVGTQPVDDSHKAESPLDPTFVSRLIHDLTALAGFDRPEAEAMVARAFLVKSSRIKNIVKKHTISVKQQND
jgi:16S rRNA (cytidine1402-2'-O)-methyltransferase